MAYDLLIKNASICDGTGAPVYGGAIAVSGGKIAEIGKVSGTARREIEKGDRQIILTRDRSHRRRILFFTSIISPDTLGDKTKIGELVEHEYAIPNSYA